MMIDPNSISQDDMDGLPQGGGGPVDPQVAQYRTPDMGPFACGNCSYFQMPVTCSILSVPVDAGGMCNLFESGGSLSDSPALGSPELAESATQDLQGAPSPFAK